ncbi:MAG: CHAT domain-containing protein [Bacteroidetes bacterium]|nr:CHAT domain-containing protein [Bacteroidota bacterium]
MQNFTFTRAIKKWLGIIGLASLACINPTLLYSQVSSADKLIFQKKAKVLIDSAEHKKQYYFKIRQAYVDYQNAAKIYEQLGYWGKAANTYHELGLTFFRTHNRAQVPSINDSAHKYFNLAIQLADKYPDSTVSIAYSLTKHNGHLKNEKNQFLEAEKLYKEAINQWHKTNKTDTVFPQILFYKFYFFYQNLNNFNKSLYAIDSFEKYSSPKNKSAAYAVNNLKCEYYYSISNFDKSLYHAKIALQNSTAYFGKDHRYTVSCYKKLANCYEQLQDRNEAEQMLLDAYAQLNASTDYARKHDILYDLSSLHFRNNNYPLAKQYFLMCANYVSKQPISSQLATYQRAPLIYYHLHLFDSATYYTQKLQKLLVDASAQNDRRSLINQSATYNSQADYYKLVKNPVKARLMARKAVGAIGKIDGRNSAKADRYINLAELELEADSIESAINHTQLALAFYKKSHNASCDSTYAATSDSWVTLSRAMSIYWKAYQKEKNTDYLKQITCLGNNLLGIYQAVLQLIPNKASKVSFKAKLKEIAELMILSHKALAQNGQQVDNEQLFAFIDKIKVYDLRWNLAGDLNTSSGYGISESVKQQIDAYKHSLSLLEGQLASTVDTAQLRILHQQFTNTKLELTALNAQIKNQYPAFYQFLYSTPSFNKIDLNNLIGNNKALLSYFIGSELAFVETYYKGNFKLYELGNANTLRDLIDNYYLAITTKNAAETQKLGLALYKILIPNELSQIEELIIIPDERIYLVPFDALIPEITNGNHYRFAMQKHQFSASFSVAYMVQNLTRPNTRYAYEYLGMALNFKSQKGSLPFLQNAYKEVEAASKYFNQNRMMLSLEASETDFTQNASKSRIIHLATHALQNNENPLLSKLVLKADNQNDGNIYLYELLNMTIPSELVILSACNTGSGNITSTDGLVSLGYGFAYAGAKNSIISLWSSPDASTSSIIENYTKYVAEGYAYDKALRKAKLTYLENADPLAAQPYYWGGLVFTGLPNSAIESNGSNWLLFTGLGIAALLLMAFIALSGRSKT